METVFGVSGVATKNRVKNNETYRLSKVLVQPSCGLRNERSSAAIARDRDAPSVTTIGSKP